MKPIFAEFFEDVWGYPPFPWQVRLAEQVAVEGWPVLLDLPTGSGKTAVLDIALFHFAMDGGRTAPRRIVLVVDRRVIVDQVGVRAGRILEALERSERPATTFVADRLREIVSKDIPLHGANIPYLETAILRGGTPRDDAWARYPHVPVLAASTVDQIGSRLLFRGYGVTDSMKPMHAGLSGCDTLLLLDEVHLARPFADVLEQLERLRGPEALIPRRFHVVQLSATPGSVAGSNFGLEAEDRIDPVLSQRLAARKVAMLDEVEVKQRSREDIKRAAVAKQAAVHARSMIRSGRRAVAVVVNRVDTARRVWSALDSKEFDRELLTGRMRPLDQQTVLNRVLHRVLADREDDPDERPLVLVATQCIEAGADFDFDGLVTECASVDALRQRFGRLNRKGARNGRAVVIGRSDLDGSMVDPVYGPALGKTWRWLQSVAVEGEVDFGIDAFQPHLDSLEDKALKGLQSAGRDAPVIMPAYLDQWVQTNPRPQADPDVSLFLHGIPDSERAAAADVRVVWRSDIEQHLLTSPQRAETSAEGMIELLTAVPPGALEAISLPVWAVRRWLTATEGKDTDDDIADVDGPSERAAASEESDQQVVVWRGREGSTVVAAGKVPPGSLIVVPATLGGLGPHHTFDPDFRGPDGSRIPVTDLGDGVQLLERGTPTLRLDKRVMDPFIIDDFTSLLPSVEDEVLDPLVMARDALDAVLSAGATPDEPKWFSVTRAELQKLRSPKLIHLEILSRWVAVGSRLDAVRLRAALGIASSSPQQKPGEAATESDDIGSFSGASQDLDKHVVAVSRVAAAFAEASGLPKEVVASLLWAGLLHDIGKADPRFQLWLLDGDEVALLRGRLLAKSAAAGQDRAARGRARLRAGYPMGQRHELVSLDMAERSSELGTRLKADGADRDLVLHLVASHHGWCRPLAPAYEVSEAEGECVQWRSEGLELMGSTAHQRGRMTSGVVERFWRLVRKYGWHELAYMEAILRLADHRCSEVAQEEISR